MTSNLYLALSNDELTTIRTHAYRQFCTAMRGIEAKRSQGQYVGTEEAERWEATFLRADDAVAGSH